MKKIIWLLSFLLIIASISIPAFAGVEQAEIKAMGKPIIEADGLQFKDLNGNGKLDIYEDWRVGTQERITDLISQMTLEEKLALMIHCNTAGQYTGTYPATDQYLYEQNCPFETPDLGKWDTASGYSCWYYINVYGVTHFLDNTNGTAEEQIEVHNAIQQMCEETRLGIPMSFSCDREYNGWGGFTDDPHDAFGTANDPELAVKLWSAYMKEMAAIGYHIVLHPFSVELGSFNGEDPEYVAKMTALEVGAIQDNRMIACTKHWIARGGDSSFANARSVAQTVDNWMVPWKAAIEAGTGYIMCSTISGLSNAGGVVFDKASMDYLRDTLRYDGVVVTDWTQIGSWGINASGVTADGIDLSTLSLKELYALLFNNGVDQIGNVSVMPGEDWTKYFMSSAYPDAMKAAVEEGLIKIETIEAADRRILRSKFELGLFENPYSDAEAAMTLCASEEYLAKPFKITNPDELAAARKPQIVALERELQAKSAVLVKNDNELLPLSKNVKIYFDSTNATNRELYAAALSKKATLVETMQEADVVLADLTVLNDAGELIVDDAKAADKPVILTLNCLEPNAWAIEKANALLFLNYKTTPDHGTALNGFSFLTEAAVYSDLLFGEALPGGMIVKEIARGLPSDGVQWKDLAGDQGASDYVRLILLATMKDNPSAAIPSNYGDPLLNYQYGMRYGEQPDFIYDTLVVPTVSVMTTNAYGRTAAMAQPVSARAGEAYTVNFLLFNRGGDGVTTVEAKEGGTVLSHKLMAVRGGQWRVVTMDVTFDEPGEHTLVIGTLSATVTVE